MTTDNENTSNRTAADRRVAQLNKKFRHLQEKFHSLHSAFVTHADMGVVSLDHPSAELAPVEVSIDPEATLTVLAVAGMALRIGMAPREFHGALSGQKCNFIFIKDFKQAWYQNGLLGLSSNIDETAEYLQTIIPANTEELRVIGSSAGGFGAIHLGVRLGAQKILAFGPQTKIGPRVFKQFETVDSVRGNYDFLARNNDLQNLFKDRPNFQGEVHVIYGAGNARDSQHAQHLSGISQIHLHPLDYAGHNAAGFLKDTGQLDQVLADFTAT
jgi:hypothetical protein